ncbi:MAG: hypothetical protein KU38_07850 [Sulfurovum sp. FS08-3]|nr:MAG: hypothetical protein KU38_07850 [Sulfurovum sp. FS08-3]
MQTINLRIEDSFFAQFQAIITHLHSICKICRCNGISEVGLQSHLLALYSNDNQILAFGGTKVPLPIKSA